MNQPDIQNTYKAKERRNNIIVIVLSVVLVVLAVMYFMKDREHKEIVTELKMEKDSIQFELSDLVVRYDSLVSENDTINEKLFLAQSKVRNLLVEIEQTKKVSLEQINSYQKQVTTLRGIMRDFVVQIDSLNRRNQELMAENLEVKQQFRKIETEKNQLSQEKQQLERNLQRAAVLQVRDLMAEGLNQRSKDTRFANRTERIRIYFVIAENISARRGAKNIYVRIMRPDQLLMTKSEKNTFQFEDLRIQFSEMREVVYEGHDLPVAIFWDNNGEPELMAGKYTIDLFADGHNIGTTTLELR
jgi:FtsZ-binding cell division protein ZapB